ncbi:MAG: hypothetical protein ACRYFX_16790 [Janthinobacterium lividum]
MLRYLLTLLLLLNYLLVVGAGLLVSRSEATFSAAHPYVHSPECQQHNYLRLDCFEQCNGDQHTAQKAPIGTGLHYLAQLKGLDVHFLVWPVGAVAAPARWQQARQCAAACQAGLPTGFGGRDYPPPQRG